MIDVIEEVEECLSVAIQLFPNLHQSPFETVKARGEYWVRRTFGYGIQPGESFKKSPVNLGGRYPVTCLQELPAEMFTISMVNGEERLSFLSVT